MIKQIEIQISEEERKRLIEVLSARKGYQYYNVIVNTNSEIQSMQQTENIENDKTE